VVALLVEIPHADLSKVTRMVLVHIRPVVMLSTSETSSTRMLAVLAYSSMAGRDVSATKLQSNQQFALQYPNSDPNSYCNLAFCGKEGNFSKRTGR
jgi:hypothetical protein